MKAYERKRLELLQLIDRMARREGGLAPHEHLGRALGMSRDGVKKAAKVLRDHGYVVTERLTDELGQAQYGSRVTDEGKQWMEERHG